MSTPATPEETGPRAAISRAPKAVLHDHLDGGLRPATVLELSAEIGHTLPAPDAPGLAEWFRAAGHSGSLERYLETFVHTVAVMQRRSDLIRVAREFALDLAADGVVYAEVRYAPEQHLTMGLTLDQVVEAVQEGFAEGTALAAEAGTPLRVGTLITAMRHQARSMEIAARRPAPRRGRGRLRHRGRRGRVPAVPAPGRLRVPAP